MTLTITLLDTFTNLPVPTCLTLKTGFQLITINDVEDLIKDLDTIKLETIQAKIEEQNELLGKMPTNEDIERMQEKLSLLIKELPSRVEMLIRFDALEDLVLRLAKNLKEELKPGLPSSSKRMTASSEKSQGSCWHEVLNAKTKIRLGFWNVRTMYETGRLAQVTAEMRLLHVRGAATEASSGNATTSSASILPTDAISAEKCQRKMSTAQSIFYAVKLALQARGDQISENSSMECQMNPLTLAPHPKLLEASDMKVEGCSA
ncbi:Indoleamine 2,3-dioxygenase 2 [Desmophyllum pertusum]|uniref:Indoleamine 2,3-dioxygenase 2 n=1 Tax=Desmophyllum pertusum TaxID=174260 RepID=A0A9X0CNK5_9CNID|nr:Indoleamine 2,3-dioxygenase 2 [Desmophyllum pertusum]